MPGAKGAHQLARLVHDGISGGGSSNLKRRSGRVVLRQGQIETGFMDPGNTRDSRIFHDSNNLDGAAGIALHGKTASDRVLVRPELFCHSFVYDRHTGRAGIFSLTEVASTGKIECGGLAPPWNNLEN